ncbi:MAG: tRNA (N6-threonylcarbamoyladenosine(37)-N6)-methyltransferase TrmO [Clostridiaceae bacterium]|jgi:tRNA-Thr(GGU) m(6)t(6)A37 methyltransferase TsaA|nr:tRNA (N6-threonylcarbamoyladenosine(37)-N6)-methyltransferase TrmO [Clostridiaceae bacterium]
MTISLNPIGYVSNEIENRKDTTWGEDVSKIILEEEYSGGLKGLDDFSHAIIIYYLDKAHFERDKHIQRKPQNREDMPLVGIFSQRGKDRPNQIGITAVQIMSLKNDTLIVKGLDAINSTPIIDIKPYYPMYDYKENATVPEWVYRLMEHYF